MGDREWKAAMVCYSNCDFLFGSVYYLQLWLQVYKVKFLKWYIVSACKS